VDTAEREVTMLPEPIAPRSRTAAELAAEFAASTPVRHVVLDDFLEPAAADALYADLPDLEQMPKSRDYVFSDKRELSTFDRHSDTTARVHAALVSDEFAGLLSELVGHAVFIDPEYHGGGFHAGAAGSYLDLHTDFNIHPAHPTWRRELNLLLYLNPGWEPSWGGELRLTDTPDRPGITVEPRFNRMVIMESTDTSFHGYERISFPPGTARRSIASYAYSLVPEGAVTPRTTAWTPQGAGPVKRLLARNWNRLVLTKNRFFGSATMKNRQV
jgi:Rps23 Pro-64 3,4-dihydroxylase Tpa1-like proline 4-hydroxylase